MGASSHVPVKSMVLRAIAGAGILSIALIAPHTLRLIKQLDRAAARRKNLYDTIRVTLWRLEREGLIKSSGEAGRRSFELTAKGTEKVGAIFARTYQIPTPTFWDGRWRILVFDMQEKRRRARTALRILLRNAGFVRLQDSVWIYPYPCDEFVELVRAHLRSGTGELQHFVAEVLESDKPLRVHFNLP